MRNKIHPAWITTIQIFLIMFSLCSIAYNTTSLFIDPISEDLNISRTATNFIITVRSTASLITLSLSGYLFKRFGIKKMMVFGAVGTALTLFFFSYAQGPIWMYVCYFLMGLCLGYLSELSTSLIILHWFEEKTSFANGIASTGSGLGGAVFTSLAGIFIGTYGWRFTYRFLAVIGFILTIIPILRIKIYPSEINSLPYGNRKDRKIIDFPGVEFKELKSNPYFWALWLCVILISYSYYVVIVGFPAHLLNIGYSIEITGTVSAITLIVMSLMKIILGYMYDEFDIAKTVLFTCIVQVLGAIAAIKAANPIFLPLAIFSLATGSANFAQSLQGVSRKLFGRKDYASILRVFMMGSNGGGLVCPVISGLAFDTAGSYIPLYKAVVVLGLILLVLNQVIIKYIKNNISSKIVGL